MPSTKGMLVSAGVAKTPSNEFGVQTDWVVVLHFQSPTGDSSDFITRELPCLTREQAVNIADMWNAQVSPELVGCW